LLKQTMQTGLQLAIVAVGFLGLLLLLTGVIQYQFHREHCRMDQMNRALIRKVDRRAVIELMRSQLKQSNTGHVDNASTTTSSINPVSHA
jgi:hypothetical protein